MHFAYVEREFAPFMEPFDGFLLSFRLHARKPEERYFQQVQEHLEGRGISPAEAVFIDDLPANVEAARRQGLHAIQCHSLPQMQEDLEAVLEGE